MHPRIGRNAELESASARRSIDRRAKADHRTCGQSWSESSPALTWN